MAVISHHFRRRCKLVMMFVATRSLLGALFDKACTSPLQGSDEQPQRLGSGPLIYCKFVLDVYGLFLTNSSSCENLLGRLPTSGQDRIRRTMLGLIAVYSTWFTTQTNAPTPTSTPSLLMNAISYVVAALPEPALCLPAANALRDLCDADCVALAPHIGAFAELHAGLSRIPDTEKSKVLQSIASVIQALPPEEEIPPIQAIVIPVIEKLAQALHGPSQLVDETCFIIISQLQTLYESPEERAEAERLQRARDDYTMVKVREDLFNTIRNIARYWSVDAGVSDALSDFFRSITSLPSDTFASPTTPTSSNGAQNRSTVIDCSRAITKGRDEQIPIKFPSEIVFTVTA
ncbi:hypothetical protein C8R48DRAFT_778120 [Suillus tomentosus]|nr:hypothetical protein C8R48DRAFT_778120 [Suillus tomentosus]